MVLGAAGAAVGIALVMRTARASPNGADTTSGTVRVEAEVHTGLEQTMVGVVRALSLVGSPGDAAYGKMFVQQADARTLLVGSRSEIGRGFRAALSLEPGRGLTRVRYAILRLPGDESLHAAVLQFELLLIEALRRLDPDVAVHLEGTALRDLERVRPASGEGAR